jgi:hypothetical protein
MQGGNRHEKGQAKAKAKYGQIVLTRVQARGQSIPKTRRHDQKEQHTCLEWFLSSGEVSSGLEGRDQLAGANHSQLGCHHPQVGCIGTRLTSRQMPRERGQ